MTSGSLAGSCFFVHKKPKCIMKFFTCIRFGKFLLILSGKDHGIFLTVPGKLKSAIFCNKGFYILKRFDTAGFLQGIQFAFEDICRTFLMSKDFRLERTSCDTESKSACFMVAGNKDQSVIRVFLIKGISLFYSRIKCKSFIKPSTTILSR